MGEQRPPGEGGEPVFARVGRHGRYAYNLRNPVGRALAVGGAVIGVVAMTAVMRPGLFTGRDRWDAGELQEAVTAAGPALETSATAGPGIDDPKESLRAIVERAGDKYEGTVDLSGGQQREPGWYEGSFTVSADGTDAEFCVTLTGTGSGPLAFRYRWVTVTSAEGACEG
ncbi:hypothetical protein ABT026_03355 [Streptomyces sp. NPDC002734]|uniref:hypothetical protein n=1 Tax=Streptomyces sp. NPDC002734 TaxID=3154426 RepID=UPI00331AE796